MIAYEKQGSKTTQSQPTLASNEDSLLNGPKNEPDSKELRV